MTPSPVRKARLEDLPGMLELYAQLQPDDPILLPERAAEIWVRMLALENVTVLVIEADGRPVSTGTITITPSLTRGGRGYAHIENVVTRADLRGAGLGHRVIDAALDLARDCYKVFLTTGSTRESTLRFYDKAGFERSKRTYFEIRRS